MRERALAFGTGGSLLGVVCEPDGGPRPGTPGFLFFNVGLNHRVGPQRMWVELARALAARGFASLRFDLSGLGDSEPRSDARSEEERAVLDLQEAMDLLQKRCGLRTFVVTGLCSGVDGAYAASRVDPRVVGAVHVDGYAYADAGYRRRQLLARLRGVLQARRWRRHLSRRFRRLRGLPADPDAETGGVEPIFDRTYPPVDSFRDALRELLARGMALLFIYTGEAYFFDRRDQFASMLGWDEVPAAIALEHWPECDHTCTTRAMREKLLARVVAWAETLVERDARGGEVREA